MTINATTYADAAAEFERVQNERFSGSRTDVECDLIALKCVADMIVMGHRAKHTQFANIATATCCQRADGTGYVGRYDIAAACQAEIDYLEVTPEAAMVVEARVAELLAGRL